MNQEEKEDLIKGWLEGEYSDEEVLKSMDAAELNQYKSILSTVDDWEPQGSDTISTNVGAIIEKRETKVVSISRGGWISGIAASILLVASIVFFLFNSEERYYADGENLQVLLPDGTTTVVLSPGAHLSYKNFDSKQRKVVLRGRAYFDVTERGSFTVEYDGGNVAVLGTQFEIAEFNDFFEVRCFEGKVEVSYQDAKLELVEQEKASLINTTLVKEELELAKPVWLSGREVFEDESLVKAIRIMELRFDVIVKADGLSLDRNFTGVMPTENLEDACRAVFSPLGIGYQVEGQSIILSE